VPEPKKEFTTEEARRFGREIGIDWSLAPFDVEQFRIGINVELEHGLHDSVTNVTDDDPHLTAKIAFAHLNEFPERRPGGSTSTSATRGARPAPRR